jgi:hypothetical protein
MFGDKYPSITVVSWLAGMIAEGVVEESGPFDLPDDTIVLNWCNLVRDLYGNPFRPNAFDPRWRTSDAVALAQAIYDERAFERLPILADALMDAGCEDEQVIAHCRSEGPHVRGCWVVDLVLGKE